MKRALMLTFALLFGLNGAVAAQSPPPAPDPASTACTALRLHDFENVPGAPTWVTSAAVAATPTGARYCEVFVHVAQQVGMQMRLPLANWNGRFWMNGNHGMGGQYVIGETDIPLAQGFAVATNDMGHHNRANDGGWAYNSMQGKVDFAYRAAHVATLAAKAIVTAYYGRKISYSYFGGWSTGGRQALMEAERYPNDFNGIIAGPAPLWSSEMQGSSVMWTEEANRNKAGQPILTPAQLPLLHDAATKACDGGDGVHDGLIADPRTCHWDPQSLLCTASAAPDTCLTAAQVAVARKFYELPHTSKGKVLYPGGMMRGSELLWTERLPYGTSPISRIAEYSLDYLRYLAFVPDAGPSYDIFSYNFDRDPQRLAKLAPLYDATNPNLRPFRAHGGKLIMWTGWADPDMAPLATLKFHQQIVAASGGIAAARSFVQLYMVPGEYHGPTGVGPVLATEDFITPIEAWVESHTVPDHVIAKETHDTTVTRTRPVYPYPLCARYRGTGDPNDAANFTPATPTAK
jgi:feruloyl esterase